MSGSSALGTRKYPKRGPVVSGMAHLAFRGVVGRRRSSHLDRIGIIGSIGPVGRVGPLPDDAGQRQPDYSCVEAV